MMMKKKWGLVALVAMMTTAATLAQTSTVGYVRPQGAYYTGVTEEWQRSFTTINVQPWADVVFNAYQPAVSQWQSNDYVKLGTQTQGESCYADDQGRLHMSVQPIPDGYLDRLLPSVTVARSKYTLGQRSRGWNTRAESYIMAAGIQPMTLADASYITHVEGKDTTQNLLSLTADNHYRIGTVGISTEGANYYCRGLVQIFEKPMAPLYVERVTLPVVSFSDTPIAPTAQLTLFFKRVVRNADGTVSAGETLHTMICTASDVRLVSKSAGGIYAFTLTFRPEAFAADLVLSDEFAVQVEGFQQDGIDMGVSYMYIDETDKEQVQASLVTLQDAGHQDIDKTLVFNDRIAAFMLWAMYDNVRVETSLLTAPDEGGACSQTATVRTAALWQYGTGRDAYELEGMPDWLTLQVDESAHDIDAGRYGYGKNLLHFSAQPLPAGVEGRTATVRLKGKGVVSDPVTITQGQPTAIRETLVDDASQGATYNLSGQRVAPDSRGVLIRGGRKVVR